MSTISLPAPLDRLVTAVNTGDTEGFLALLASDCVVEDWGRVFRGATEIRRWSDRELIGAKGVLSVRSMQRENEQIVLIIDWTSTFYTGPGRFIFKIENGLISSWNIEGP